ncbi:MAG: hypothetical protein OXC60_08565 [Litoreibacter sp.]|nr:hypothetical protein [Litoreibacter sp.]
MSQPNTALRAENCIKASALNGFSISPMMTAIENVRVFDRARRAGGWYPLLVASSKMRCRNSGLIDASARNARDTAESEVSHFRAMSRAVTRMNLVSISLVSSWRMYGMHSNGKCTANGLKAPSYEGRLDKAG